MNLDDTITRAIAVRDELTKAIEQAQTKDEWPKAGEHAWYLGANGPHRVRWDGGEYDQDAFARGTVYRTQAAAERADQRRIVEAELRKMARAAGPVGAGLAYEIRRGDKGWKPFWAEHSGMPRFPTRESAEAAIAAITPERLDLLLDEGE